ICLIGIAIVARYVARPDIAAAKNATKGTSGLRAMLRDRTLRAIILIGTLSALSWDLFSFIFPIYAAHAGHTASIIGSIVGAYSLTSLAVRVVLPVLSRRHGTLVLILFSLFWTGGTYLIFPLFTDAVMLAVLSIVLALGMGMTTPLSLV